MRLDYTGRFHARWALLLGSLSLLMLLTAQTPAPDDCAGLVAPRLGFNAGGRALVDDGLGLVLRDAPGTSSIVIDNLPEGALFIVTSDAPTCTDGVVWWAVRLPDGREGFVAEGASGRYFAEPWVIGAHIFLPDSLNPNQLNHFFIERGGSIDTITPLTLPAQSGPMGQFWQEPEIIALESGLRALSDACPERLPANFDPVVGVRALNFQDTARRYFPAPAGEHVLIIREYGMPLLACDANLTEQFGTSYVSLLTTGGDLPVFPFSQHSQPPPSSFCGPQIGPDLDRPTTLDGLAWSADARYLALSVRYLRDNENFPCAFYHLFVIDTQSLDVTYITEGRRPGWRGRRLIFARIERDNPNDAGIERLFSVLPDGGDLLEIPLPPDVTILPIPFDETRASMPWSSASLLVCTDDCDDILTLHLPDGTPITAPIPPPDDAKPGSDLISLDFVAGDTALLWLNTNGELFLQIISDGDTVRVARELNEAGRIVAVIPYEGGLGAILRLEDGRFFDYNLVDDSTRPIEGIRG